MNTVHSIAPLPQADGQRASGRAALPILHNIPRAGRCLSIPDFMTKETYFAVRIGDPKRRQPYFMLGPDNETPALFVRRDAAAKACPKQSETKVVKVVISEISNN